MKTTDISRRQFLKGAFAGALGITAMSVLGGCAFASGAPSGSAEVSSEPSGTAAAFANTHTNPLDIEKRTVLLNNGMEMPIFGIGTYILTVE